MIHSVNASCSYTLLPKMTRAVTSKRKDKIFLQERVEKKKGVLVELKKSDQQNEKKKSKSPKSIFWSFVNIGLYIALCLVIPGLLNSAALQREFEVLRPIGSIFVINNGQKMHMNCTGKGVPVVILDAPTGMTSDVWVFIQKEIAKITKVCVYDRAGLGFSERGNNISVQRHNEDDSEDEGVSKWKGKEFTTERMVDDLRQLILTLGLEETPVILVGSEIASINVRFYAQLYERHVTDIVLIDPIMESLFIQDGGIWSQYWFNSLIPAFQALQMGALVGINRLGLLIGLIHPFISGDNIPDNILTTQKYLLCNPRHMSSVVDEYYYINETFTQFRLLWQMKSFPTNISVTVINRVYYDTHLSMGLNKAWAKAQKEFVSSIHSESKHIVINGVNRSMLYQQPLDISEPIIRLIEERKQKYSEDQK